MTALEHSHGASLERVLAPWFSARRGITRIERRPAAERSSFLVDEIDVRFGDGTRLALFAKAVHWQAMAPEARSAKPLFLWNPERERETYESILSPLAVDAARYFGSYVIGAVRYLLLERLDGTPLWQFGDFEAWREAGRWLARMHARVGAAGAMYSRAAAHLLRYDPPFYGCWMERAQAFHESSAGLDGLAARYPRIVEALLAERETFIHGEFYPANVLVERRADRQFTVRPIDWEMASFGPALMDVACLIAGRWSDEARADVADTYFAERAALGGGVPARDHYLKTLDYCLIHLSIRNLGWSRDWSPPSDRAHDWLSEALRLCEKWTP
jgi:hypothetical protein